MHILEAGDPSGPLLILLHGFPELSYSWRKVMVPLSNAGYRVVAPDQRGYGRTKSCSAGDSPIQFDDDLSPFRILNLVHDIIALVYALGCTSVLTVVGHDFGSLVAAHCALIRPDLFKSLVCMSAPYPGPPSLPFNTENQSTPLVHQVSPSVTLDKFLRSLDPPKKHYTAYLSGPDAGKDMHDPPEGLHDFVRAYFHVKSGDWPVNNPHLLGGVSELTKLPHYYIMPAGSSMPEAIRQDAPSKEEAVLQNLWLPEEDLDVFVEEFGRNGFQGGLNWYRAMTDEQLTVDLSLFAGKKIDVPAMFLGGAKDWGVYQSPGALEKMRLCCTRMRGEDVILVDGAGHWIQQEHPGEVSRRLLHFIEMAKSVRRFCRIPIQGSEAHISLEED